MLMDFGETGAQHLRQTDCDVDVWIAWDFSNAFAAREIMDRTRLWHHL